MEVRTGGTAGGAHQADQLALLDHLPGSDEDARHVTVDRIEAVAMVDLNVNPVVTPAGEHHLPGIGGQLWRSLIVCDIDSWVKLPEVLRDDPLVRPRESDEMLAAHRWIRRRPARLRGRRGSRDIFRPHGGNEEFARQLRVGG